jgi:hypothetical protein
MLFLKIFFLFEAVSFTPFFFVLLLSLPDTTISAGGGGADTTSTRMACLHAFTGGADTFMTLLTIF